MGFFRGLRNGICMGFKVVFSEASMGFYGELTGLELDFTGFLAGFYGISWDFLWSFI